MMSKINYYNCPTHWKHIAKKQVKPNRCGRKYVSTMNLGKRVQTSVPLIYVLKTLDIVNLKKNLKEYLENDRVLINNKVTKEKRAPVGLLDYVTILGEENKTFQLRFEKNELSNVNNQPVLKPHVSEKTVEPVRKSFIGKRDTLKVQTFQNNLYSFAHTGVNTKILKGLFSCVIKEKDTVTISDLSDQYKLLEVIRITGKNKFKIYEVEHFEEKIENQSSKYLLHLKTKLQNLKKQILSKEEFRSRYTFTFKPNVEYY